MAALRTLFTFTLVGVVLGSLAGLFVGRAFLPWYNSPGNSNSPAMCACEELVQSTVDSMLHYQLVGMTTGAVLFLILGILVVRGQSAKAKAAALQAQQTPPPPAGPTPPTTGMP